jgi:predicted CXXCH cytochrome family protein
VFDVPRAALKALCAAAVFLTVGTAHSLDPHLDKSIVPGGCNACHKGHGMSRSPMLKASQSEVCLQCHGTAAERDELVRRGDLSADAKPGLLSAVMSQPFSHPIDERAFSRDEPGVVTCSSCHSPHRSRIETKSAETPLAGARPSQRDPSRTETELCEDCHGGGRKGNRSRFEISGLVDSRNPSFHPLEASARNSAPSVIPELAGGMINCTDCHGNNNVLGARGPHGSFVPGMLVADYSMVDGVQESEATYAVCYQCHVRQAVLDSTVFPEHRRHVVAQKISCASCHDAHGSPENAALIRIGGSTAAIAVAPSLSTGRLEFKSMGSGAGSCFLTCHGHDHGPSTYGGAGDFTTPEQSSWTGMPPTRVRGERTPAERRDRKR